MFNRPVNIEHKQMAKNMMIGAFDSTFTYEDDLIKIGNIHFEQDVHRIDPAELQLNISNASDTKAAFKIYS